MLQADESTLPSGIFLLDCPYSEFEESYPGLTSSFTKPRAAHRYPAELIPGHLYLGDWKHAEDSTALDHLNVGPSARSSQPVHVFLSEAALKVSPAHRISFVRRLAVLSQSISAPKTLLLTGGVDSTRSLRFPNHTILADLCAHAAETIRWYLPRVLGVMFCWRRTTRTRTRSMNTSSRQVPRPTVDNGDLSPRKCRGPDSGVMQRAQRGHSFC